MAGPVRFGRFWLHERIGRGGMADVYRATVGDDPYRFSLEFALKRMHDSLVDDPTFVDMFLIEEYVQGLLHHQNIIQMYESGRHQDRIPFIALEFVRGRDLESLLKLVIERGLRVPLDVALAITLEVLTALDYAHGAVSPTNVPLGLIHRDVTPGNIYVGFDGRVKLGDFGVAHVNVLEPHEHSNLLKGKVAYVAPETILGSKPTQRDDLWSVAVCLFEMLSAQRYFENGSEETIMKRVGTGRLPSTRLPPGATRKLQKLMRTVLHRRPAKRPSTAADFRRILIDFAKEQSIPFSRENVARFVLAMCGDVDVLARQQEVPVRDHLTGAISDRYLHQQLSLETDRARRYRRDLAVVSFNIDGFRHVNEQGGALVGDELLCAIVRTFLPEVMRLRSHDVIARRRGDHFTVVLPETDFAGASVVAERLCREFRTHDWSESIPRVKGVQSKLTVSIGFSCLGVSGNDATELLQTSDDALARAKRAGGNSVAYAPRLDDARAEATIANDEKWLAWEMQVSGDENAELQSIRLEFRTESDLIAAYAQDIKGGGLRAVVPVPLEEGEEIRLALLILDATQPLLLRARVSWIGRDGMVGLQFLEPAIGLQQRVETLVWRRFNAADDENSPPATSARS